MDIGEMFRTNVRAKIIAAVQCAAPDSSEPTFRHSDTEIEAAAQIPDAYTATCVTRHAHITYVLPKLLAMASLLHLFLIYSTD